MLAVWLYSSLVWLCNGDTIKWTNAGGNPSWGEPRNWDLGRVPTKDDDVIIDVPNIPGTVRVDDYSVEVHSLTIGGTSGFLQSLVVYKGLTVGSGSIKGNGALDLESSPELPFFTYGLFDGADRFFFLSGGLSGPGKFHFTNITFEDGSSIKSINSTVYIQDLTIDSSDGGTGYINIVGGTLTVGRTLKTSQCISIQTHNEGSLNVTGTFVFSPSLELCSGTIDGDANIGRMEVVSGGVSILNGVVIGKCVIYEGASVTMGDGTQTILDVSGEGSLGCNVGFHFIGSTSSIGSISLSTGVYLTLLSDIYVGTYTQVSGYLQPTPQFTMHVNNLDISDFCWIGASIIAARANISGTAYLTNNSLTITDTMNILPYWNVQFQLTHSSSLIISSTAVVYQLESEIGILAQDDLPGKQFIMNGRWLASQNLGVYLPTSGTGTFSLKSAQLKVIGSPFSIQTVELSSSSLVIQSVVSVGEIIDLGNGIIENNGDMFATQNLKVSKFIQNNGVAMVSSGSIDTLELALGVFNITGMASGPVMSIGNLNFVSGLLSGVSKADSIIMASNLTISGTIPQTFSSLTLKAPHFTSSCGSQQCQMFTQNAKLILGNPTN